VSGSSSDRSGCDSVLRFFFFRDSFYDFSIAQVLPPCRLQIFFLLPEHARQLTVLMLLPSFFLSLHGLKLEEVSPL